MLTDIQKVRITVGDTSVEFPLLDDNSYAYFLEKNYNSIPKSALDAASAIMMVLSTRNSETVDIFSVKNTSAEQYRLALQLFLRDPAMNPVLQNCQGWVGGVSKDDILANYSNTDNHVVTVPSQPDFTDPSKVVYF